MNWPKLKSRRAGRLARTAAMMALAGAAIGGTTVLTAGAASAAIGTSPGTLVLTPGGSTASPTSTSPTWSTTVGCPTGFQSSAVVKEVHADGTTTNSVSVFVNSATVPLTGPIPAQPLQATAAQIQAAGGIPNGGTQELFVTCYSQYSGTGSARNEMDIYITYSASGSTYTTTSSGTGTSGGGTSSTPSPGGAGSGSLSGVSSSPPGGSLNPSPMSPTSPASVAPSPSPFDSSFAVTG